MAHDLSALCSALEKTLEVNLEQRRAAEAFLKNAEKDPNYCLSLIMVLNKHDLPNAILMSASITLKNFIKKLWKVESDCDDHISQEARNQLKAQLIDALLTSSGTVQHQLSECIAIIGEHDFPHNWPTLVPDLIQRMEQHGSSIDRVVGILQIANSVFKRYRYESASDDLYREMKLVIGQFGQPLMVLLQHLTHLGLDSAQSKQPTELVLIFKAVHLAFKVFFSLNCQDLPEFFEDNIETWMTLHRRYLVVDADLSKRINEATSDDRIVEEVKSQVCDNIGLYATKYEEEFSPFLQNFITDVWDMLLSPNTKDDIIIGNSIHFISSVVAKPQHKHLFENPETLQKLCEMVIIPNMEFKSSDEELFEDTPDEYLTRDLEGSDSHTRRHSACQLVYNLCRAFEGPVVANFSTYIEHLLSKYQASQNQATGENPNWISKDAALMLVTTVSTKAKTEKDGATTTTNLVDIQSFFNNHILPELTSAHVDALPVIKADCIRYVITFRNHLNHESLVKILNAIPHLLSAKSWVVHTYACYLLDKLFLLTNPENPTVYLLDRTHIADANLLFQRVLAVLSMPNSLENVHAIKALLRCCLVLRDTALPSLGSIVSTLCQRVQMVAANPAKPQFNHFLFETIAFCIYMTCSYEPSAVLDFEQALFPIFQEIMQKDVSEFIPYVFQLISILLEQYPLSDTLPGNNNPASGLQLRMPSKPANLVPSSAYTELIPRVLTPALWSDPHMVPSLSRIVQAYIIFKGADLLQMNKTQNILGIYQRLLQLKSFDHYAFCIFLAACESFPKSVLEPLMKQLFVCIFQRLTAAKTDKFMRALTYFISQFLLVYSPQELITLIESIQSGLFGKLVEKVLITQAKLVIPLSVSSSIPVYYNWRSSTVGLTRLLCECPDMFGPRCSNPSYAKLWSELMFSVVQGLAAGPARGGTMACEQAVHLAQNPERFMLDGRLIEVDADRLYSLASSQLNFAPQNWPDFCANIHDPRQFFMQSIAKILSTQPGILQSIMGSCSDANTVQSFQALMQQTGVQVI